MSEPTQIWNPELYSENARFVTDMGAPVVELLAPRVGERILDLGCGDGVLTAKLAALGCEVVGVDSSPEFVEAAKRLGVDARLLSGEALAFDAEFDAVSSNAALHWMKRPERVIDGVWRALKPGGRFVGEFGGKGNIGAISGALRSALGRRGTDYDAASPWYFPAPEEYRALLEARGFRVEQMALIARPTPLPTDIRGWLATFAGAFTKTIPEAERGGFIEELVDLTRPVLCDAEGNWTADYVRLRFFALKP